MERQVLIAALAVALGCGGSAPGRTQAPQVGYSCDAGALAPPAKLIIPASGGVSGRWIVVLTRDVSLHATATALAVKFGGRVLDEWEIINGFLIALDDSKAAPLSEEPVVCFVEQDQIVSDH